jgi:SAM-dependent methyltransferase
MSPEPGSPYNPDAIARHFDAYGRKEWDRLVATPVDEVSLHVHTHYLKQYVPAGAHVLEIGAGAGRFTQVLAGLGARIVVADISQVQLDLNDHFAKTYRFDHAVEDRQQVDICDMRQFVDASFDCVVAYGGPLSYVLNLRDAALRECWRVLIPGGTLLLSVMALWGSAHRALKGVLLGTPIEVNQRIVGTGDLSSETFPGRDANHMHLFRAAELRRWLAYHGWTILALSASNCLSTSWDELLAEIRGDAERWGELLRMELEASAEEGALDMGTHLIAVARK